MRDTDSIKKELHGRVKPTIFNARYYHLKELKRSVLGLIDRYLASNTGKVLVDYGCGSMPYKEYFIPYVGKYIGADIEENSAADVKIIDGKLNMPDASADFVLSTQVLEHVSDPQLYLREAFRVLRSGGLLIISTHGIWRYHPDPTDYWRWTCDGLRKIITEHGGMVKEVEGIMGLAATGVLLFQDAFLFKLPKVLRYLFIPPMQLLMIGFDKLNTKANKAKDASVFVFVAQKR